MQVYPLNNKCSNLSGIHMCVDGNKLVEIDRLIRPSMHVPSCVVNGPFDALSCTGLLQQVTSEYAEEGILGPNVVCVVEQCGVV